MENVRIISGRSNPELSQSIAHYLGLQLLPCIINDFSNTEIHVQIGENVRGIDVIIIQTGSNYNNRSVNDHFMELKLLARACKLSSVRSITAIIPYYPYSRADKKDVPRVCIGAALVASEIENAGVDRIVSIDLHSGQTQGFTTVPFDNLYGINLITDYLKKCIFGTSDQSIINENYILVSPDNGGVKRVDAYAKKLNMDFLIMHKQRDYTKSSTILKSMIIGDESKLIGKTAIIIDDMIDTMGTMVSAANELSTKGVKNVIIGATHGIFSGPAIQRINECSIISDVIVTNTLAQSHNQKICNKIKVIDTGNLFAEVIKRLIVGGSISEIFE